MPDSQRSAQISLNLLRLSDYEKRNADLLVCKRGLRKAIVDPLEGTALASKAIQAG
jgi:hypothetical protein